MTRFARMTLTVVAVAFGITLAGCEGFDPTTIMDNDFFNTKKRLPGERKPVFPEGTPGVPQGVPRELIKGYQPTEQAEEAQSTAQAPQAEPKTESKAKPKPKPKVVAKPKEESTSNAGSVRPAQAQSQVQWPDPPPVQQQPPAAAWPNAVSPPGSSAVAWPDPPAPR